MGKPKKCILREYWQSGHVFDTPFNSIKEAKEFAEKNFMWQYKIIKVKTEKK